MTTVRPIRTITTAEAKITTVEVSIRTVTIGQKQMTLSVYKQLYSEPLIDTETTQLRGVPWGKVNYFPGDCKPDHLHIVWQKGAELRRACVYAAPWVEEADPEPVAYVAPPVEQVSTFATTESTTLARLVTTWIRLLLLTEQTARIVAFFDRDSWHGNAPPEYFSQQHVWPLLIQGTAVEIVTSEDIRAALLLLLHKQSIEAYRTPLSARLTAHAVADLPAAETRQAAVVLAQVKRLRDFRDQWRAQHDALDALDHLFIAV